MGRQKSFSSLLVGIISNLLLSCSTIRNNYARDFSKLEIGMDKNEIEKILTKPVDVISVCKKDSTEILIYSYCDRNRAVDIFAFMINPIFLLLNEHSFVYDCVEDKKAGFVVIKSNKISNVYLNEQFTFSLLTSNDYSCSKGKLE